MSDRLNIKHNSISFWRIVFTLLVVLIHCGYTPGGYIAVEFFFLVSGFLLAKSIFEKKQTIWEFITHRLKRLYPMYLFALIVYMLLMSAVGFLNDGYSARLFLVNFLENVAQQWKSFFMLQVFGLDTITVNFAAWYVAALFWVSVLYFIIAKILPRKAYLIFIAATSLALLIYFFFTTGHLDLGEGHRFFMCEGVPRAYFEMGIGILLYNLKAFLDDKKVTINRTAAIAIELAGYVSILVAICFLRHTRWDFLFLLIMTVCVFLSFSEHRKGLLCNKVFDKLSSYSYGVYLNHSAFLVIVGFFGFPIADPSSIVKLSLVLPSAIVVSIIGMWLIDIIMKKVDKSSAVTVLRVIAMMIISAVWIYLLRDITASLMTYIIIAVIAVVMSAFTSGKTEKVSVLVVSIIVSAVLSFMIVLSHYYIFIEPDGVIRYLPALIVFVIGDVLFYYILACAYNKLKAYTFPISNKKRISPNLILIIATVVFIIINVTIVVLCKYPCDFMVDSLWQLDEIRTGNLTNHHSVYHTLLLALFYKAGEATGIGVGHGMFLFIVFQIIVVGLVAGYLVKTLYEMKVPIILTILAYLFMLINPISLKYIVFIDKDELFVYMGMLFAIALTRILLGVGRSKYSDWVYMIIGGLGYGLFRSNGMLVIIVAMIVALLYKTDMRRTLLIIFTTLTVVIVMLNGSVRSLMGVKSTEFSEGLSIPIQQVSRVVYDNNELTADEEEAINKLVNVDVIKKQYDPIISDPIKSEIQWGGNDDYMREHKSEYLKLYMQLGLKYPGEYLKAWIEQTRGYWTPGYGSSTLVYGKYTSNVMGLYVEVREALEAEHHEIMPSLITALNTYAHAFETNPLLYQFIEIGGLVFALIILFIIKLWKRSKTTFIEVLSLATIATLCLAAPLEQEIRYAYIVFPIIYLSIATTFYRDRGSEI